MFPQDISPYQNSYAIRYLARASLADGLGYITEGASVGEPTDGLAIVRRLYAGNTA